MMLKVGIAAQGVAEGESRAGGFIKNGEVLTRDIVADKTAAFLVFQIAAYLRADAAAAAGGTVAVNELDGGAAPVLAVADIIGHPTNGIRCRGHIGFDVDFLEKALSGPYGGVH